MLLSYKKLFEAQTPKVGDMVICIGDIDDLKTNNHIGYLRNRGIEFVNRFSDKLHDLGGELKNNKGWFIGNPDWMKPFDHNDDGNNIPLMFSEKFKNTVGYGLRCLLDYEKIYFTDVSFIDTTLRSDTISCLSATNFHKLEENEDPWTSTMRQNIRIGRFLRKVFKDSDKIIEDYTNEYKFSYNLSKDDFGRFKIAKDIDMAKWYLEIFYAPGGGSLHSSCMKHVRSQRRLPIYTENPEKVRLLYIANRDNKLLGRALIWKLDEPHGRTYMDRVYYTEEYIEKLFYDYAEKKGFLTKFEVDKEKLTLIVKLGRDYGPPQENPYMDTFKFFVRDDNYLTNRFKNFKGDEYWEYVDHD